MVRAVATACALLASSFLGCTRAGDSTLRQGLSTASSKDGLALGSVLGDQIHIIPFDGPELYLIANPAPSVAVFGTSGTRVLWWVSGGFLDFYGEVTLTSLDGRIIERARPQLPGFRPLALHDESRRLAFIANARTRGGPSGLYWAELQGQSSRFISEIDGGSEPDWSPSGRSLVYQNREQIYVFDTTTGTSMKLVDGHDPTWAQNGVWISYTAPDGRASLISTRGVPQSWALGSHRPISPIRWSPNGRFVAFSERLPPLLRLSYTSSQLLVSRVSDGETIAVHRFSWEAVNWKNFSWIFGYKQMSAHYAVIDRNK